MLLNDGDEIQRQVEQRRARWDSGIGYQDRDIFEAFFTLLGLQRKLILEVILTLGKLHTVAETQSREPAVLIA